jgi:hypothetical protein
VLLVQATLGHQNLLTHPTECSHAEQYLPASVLCPERSQSGAAIPTWGHPATRAPSSWPRRRGLETKARKHASWVQGVPCWLIAEQPKLHLRFLGDCTLESCVPLSWEVSFSALYHPLPVCRIPVDGKIMPAMLQGNFSLSCCNPDCIYSAITFWWLCTCQPLETALWGGPEMTRYYSGLHGLSFIFASFCPFFLLPFLSSFLFSSFQV